jgi:hypothetical protein
VRLAFLAATFAILTLAACGGDDDGPSDTLGAITPVGTKDATPTPPSDGGAPPSPAVPELDEELTLYLSALLQATILPGESYPVDPTALGEQAGTPPSCDNFQFGFGWQVIDPYPPDGVILTWQLEREGGTVDIAAGTAGVQATGCDALNMVNGGTTPITVAVHYIIGGR